MALEIFENVIETRDGLVSGGSVYLRFGRSLAEALLVVPSFLGRGEIEKIKLVILDLKSNLLSIINYYDCTLVI